MQPRAFVVMPFGQKIPVGFGGQQTYPKSEDKIDFDRVYKELFEPALRQAGFEVVRADSEVAAGDIRTDMFFELVTADLVVADISILNANVFYELGVRHGVCPRGVFIVNGNLIPSRPFDIAPDRSFSYEASRFFGRPANNANASSDESARFQEQLESLTKRFKDAVALDRETVGSPVYAHLPGLKSVNWDNIATSKAKYFTALQSDWLDCVRNAQAAGHPGDILTLAMNAPTRLHESKILYEAAIALIDLCRYTAAERVLRDVIRLDPAHTNAQLQLALVLSHLGKSLLAEHQLRKISWQHRDDPQAADLLGQVFRHLWHLSWHNEYNPTSRRQKAQDASQIAISAIHSFLRAHRSDPKAYFAGFNALMLAYVLGEVNVDFTPTQIEELKILVRYVATNERQQAIEDGNYVQQFWCATTLAGILFMDGDHESALANIRAACAIPAATSFQLQSFRERLELLDALEVKSEFVKRALEIVNKAIGARSIQCSCERVFLWSGYPIDDSKRQQPRFPSNRVEVVTNVIERILKDEWSLNSRDLGICGGTTESDIIFAEICLRLGARIRIMLREPIGAELSEPLWPFRSPDWQQRFHQLLLPGERKEIWIDTEHLGTPVEGSGRQDSKCFVTRRQKQWLINTAQMEAEPIMKDSARAAEGQQTLPGPGRLYGLFLWEEGGRTDDPEDPSFFIRRVSDFNGYQGQVKTISPQNCK
jgi:tetratricopeptide (TPR) repeat protein